MTARALTNNLFSKNFMTNLKYKVKSNFRVMVILLILHLVAAPLNLINLIVYRLKLGQYELAVSQGTIVTYPEINTVYPIIGGVTTCLAAVSVLIVAMNIYTYLYKKSVVDMTLSLPMTTGQRFFSDLLAGGIVYLVPFLISCVLSVIINACGGAIVVDWDSSERFGNITSLLFTLIIAGIFIMLMAYALSVLVHTCCGSTFETLAYSILANGLIPGTIAVFGYIFLGNLYGIDISSSILPIIEKTSPIGGLIMLIRRLEDQSTSGQNVFSLEASWVIPTLLITAVFVAGAYFLNKYRRAEQVSRPFVYKAFYYVMITMLTFCIGVLFTMDDLSKNIMPLVIITAVIYLIFEVITNRGFRKLYISAIRYAITIAAVISLSLSVESTGGFGAVARIPDASSVKSVQMNYVGIFGWLSQYSDPIYTYDDPENIEAIIKMHRRVLENYSGRTINQAQYADELVYENAYGTQKSTYLKTIEVPEPEAYNPADNTLTFLRLTYTLKNGQHITRNYSLTVEECMQMISIDSTEEFKENYVAALENYYNNRKKTYGSSYRGYDSFISLQGLQGLNYSSTQISLDRGDELIACLSEDIRSLSTEEYFRPSSDVLGYISIAQVLLPINDNYTNVLLFLKKYGLSLPANQFDAAELQLLISSQGIFIVPPEEGKMTVDGAEYYFNFQNNYSWGNDLTYDEYGNIISPYVIPQDIEALTALLSHVQPNYLTTEPCYFLYSKGMNYVIPPQYTALAEELYLQAKNAENTTKAG